jgi:hypothetical protein
METRLSLRYEGPAVDDGLMPVHEAAASMVAFSEFMVTAVKITYGDQADARAEVAGYTRGSFVTDLVFHVAGVGATLLTAVTPKEILEVVKQSFDLWKFLKGLPPEKVDRVNNGVEVTNNNGQIINVRTEAFSIVVNEQSSSAVEGFVRGPLSRAGIERLVVTSGAKSVMDAKRSEADYFHPVLTDVPVSSNTVHMTLIIESSVFRDDLKWRFNDGSASFSALITDVEFLASVDRGERFGKGDRLDVVMRIDQTRRGDKFTVERTIEQVLRHLPASEQVGLFARGSDL